MKNQDKIQNTNMKEINQFEEKISKTLNEGDKLKTEDVNALVSNPLFGRSSSEVLEQVLEFYMQKTERENLSFKKGYMVDEDFFDLDIQEHRSGGENGGSVLEEEVSNDINWIESQNSQLDQKSKDCIKQISKILHLKPANTFRTGTFQRLILFAKMYEPSGNIAKQLLELENFTTQGFLMKDLLMSYAHNKSAFGKLQAHKVMKKLNSEDLGDIVIKLIELKQNTSGKDRYYQAMFKYTMVLSKFNKINEIALENIIELLVKQKDIYALDKVRENENITKIKTPKLIEFMKQAEGEDVFRKLSEIVIRKYSNPNRTRNKIGVEHAAELLFVCIEKGEFKDYEILSDKIRDIHCSNLKFNEIEMKLLEKIKSKYPMVLDNHNTLDKIISSIGRNKNNMKFNVSFHDMKSSEKKKGLGYFIGLYIHRCKQTEVGEEKIRENLTQRLSKIFDRLSKKRVHHPDYSQEGMKRQRIGRGIM